MSMPSRSLVYMIIKFYRSRYSNRICQVYLSTFYCPKCLC